MRYLDNKDMTLEETHLKLNKSIYIDLDSLYDTRLATVKEIDNVLAISELDNVHYLSRVYEEFGYVTNNVFSLRYQLRNNKTLKDSFVTRALHLLILECESLMEKHRELDVNSIITVDINMFPYNIGQETQEMIIKIIKTFNRMDNVEYYFINVNPKKYSLQMANDTYNVMIMYEGLRWLDICLTKRPYNASNVHLYVPALLMDAMVLTNVKDIENIFEAQAKLYSPYINMTMLPIEYFSYMENFKEKIIEQYK